MSASNREEGFRPDIEGLRGVAVALVVIYHAGLLAAASVQLQGGFIGVDLFFVVSGFLITGLLIREREKTGRTNFAKFYARRVRRILPAAAVTLLVTIPLAYLLVARLDRPSAMEDAASAALSVANIRFGLTFNYFNPSAATYSPFLHFWSLGVEEQFYFIWPALLALVAFRWPRVGAFIALSIVVVASFIANYNITFLGDTSWAFYMLPTRAWQLAAGGLLAVCTGSLDRVGRGAKAAIGSVLAVAGWAALAILLVGAVVLSPDTPYPGTAALLPTITGVLLIASGREPLGPGRLLSTWPIRFLGKISYSLYLWHWPILILGGLYLNGALQTTLTVSQAIGLALLAIPVATVSWALVEEPFRRGRIPLPRPNQVVFGGVVVMLIVALLGGSFSWTAQSALAGYGTDPVAEVDTPQPELTDQPTIPPTTPPSSGPTHTARPNATPTPAPVSPILAPTPAWSDPGAVALNSATRPSLTGAKDDKEKIWFDSCLGWDQNTVPRTDCVYGDTNGTYTVALVGDSHASALFPAIQAIAKAHHWKLIPYVKVACTFIDMRLDNFLLKREYPECATWNANVVTRLNSQPPDLILVSNSRWMFPHDDANANPTAEGNGVGRELLKLPKKSRLVIIQDPPLPAFDVPKCLSENTGNVAKCAYARSAGYGYYMGAREKIESEMTGAPIVDLSTDICPGTGACPVVIRNMIVWRDDHHLTATFAATLAPSIDQKLCAILAPDTISTVPSDTR